MADDDSSMSDAGEDQGVTSILTPEDCLREGLALWPIRAWKVENANDEVNVARFRSQYGVSPTVCAQVWHDLQSTTIQDAVVPIEKRKIKYLFLAFYFLRKYPTARDCEILLDIGETAAREWTKFFLQKIAALQALKIKWSDVLIDGQTWVMTVDGTHCWTKEPGHPVYSHDRKAHSHKLNTAGLTYELGVLLTGSLVWINGPFKAGTNDLEIFLQPGGLKARLLQAGKKAIGDKGYRGHHEAVSTQNSTDDRPIRKFKTRALNRHEKINGRIKMFKCMTDRFRHSTEYHNLCFRCCCVLTVYDTDTNPLYDILIEDVFGNDSDSDSSGPELETESEEESVNSDDS